MPFGLTFAAPWLLLALLTLPLLPRSAAWGWRVLALALLVVALAQPGLGRPSRDVALVVDVSDSLGEAGLTAAREVDLSGLRTKPTVFYFGGDATAVPSVSAAVPDFLDTTQTDLARALQVAQASGASRALLLSDGAESVGDALLTLPGLAVDVLQIPSRDNVRLVGLLAPEQVSPLETVEVTAIVESDRAGTVTLRPTAGGEDLAPVTVQVEKGRQAVSFNVRAGADGALPVGATLQPDFDQPTSDDSAAVDIDVNRGSPVLVIDDPALSALLQAQGIEVRAGSPADLTAPLPYDAVVLRGGAGNYTSGQLELLKTYVQDGGGLLMTGGPESFGFGAWYRTPVEEVLPVNTDLRTEVELPLVALVIVMDRSQSMATGNPSKIDLAKEGAVGVVDLAYQDDLLGLIVFSDANATEWAFDLRRATERGKREMVNAILNIETQGGTVLEPAYKQAIDALAKTQAAIKHIIILSDGKLYDGGVFGAPGQPVDFNSVAAGAGALGITTSAIALGEGADFERLESIARSGGGRYYAALDVNTLPRIFTNEALTATRSLLREDTFAPTLRANPLVPEGLSAPPALDAYIATTLKPTAETLLEGLQGEPVLAVSRQGLGRSAALTTDLNTWAGPLGQWDALPGLLGTVTRWLQTRPADFSATITREGTRFKVVVDAVRSGDYVNDLALEARYGGTTTPLAQIAPGSYEGFAPAAGGGTLLVLDGDDIVARESVAADGSEFDTALGETLLRTVAERTGGEFYTALDRYAPLTPDAATPLWPWVALAGLVVFLLELVLRRFGAGDRGGTPVAGD
ncbi:VWA domain-containing protein [soil metagenome]